MICRQPNAPVDAFVCPWLQCSLLLREMIHQRLIGDTLGRAFGHGLYVYVTEWEVEAAGPAVRKSQHRHIDRHVPESSRGRRNRCTMHAYLSSGNKTKIPSVRPPDSSGGFFLHDQGRECVANAARD